MAEIYRLEEHGPVMIENDAERAEGILEECIEEAYDTVLVIGYQYTEDGHHLRVHTSDRDLHAALGRLERARAVIINAMAE